MISVQFITACSPKREAADEASLSISMNDIDSPDPNKRAAAWISIGYLYKGEEGILKKVPEGLDDPSFKVRWGTLCAIREGIKQDAEPYIEKIESLATNDENDEVRGIAAQVLDMLKSIH